MKRKRKNYKPEEKVAIIKRHLIDKIPVSDLCDEYKNQASKGVFWHFQNPRLFSENQLQTELLKILTISDLR